jgi:hypothetical protein
VTAVDYITSHWLERLTASPPRTSLEERRRRARKALAIKLQREAAEF